MTYNQSINLFRSIANSHYQIKSFGHGQLSEMEGEKEVDEVYPKLWVTPAETNIRENTTERTFDVLVFDLVHKDLSNRDDVLSDTEQILTDVIKIVKHNANEYTVVGDTTAQPFEERFGDDVTGWAASLTIESDLIEGTCDVPSDMVVSIIGGNCAGNDCSQPSFDCNDLNNCQVIQDLIDEDINLDVRVTALENASGGAFIPLAGTTSGNDAAGTIQFANGLISVAQSINGDDGSYLGLNGQISSLTQYNTATNSQSALNLIGAQFALAGFDMGSGIVVTLSNDSNGALQFVSNNPYSGGIIGNQDFSINYDPLSFIQKAYADNTYVPVSLSTLGGLTTNVLNQGQRFQVITTDTNTGNNSLFDIRSTRFSFNNTNIQSGINTAFNSIGGQLRIFASDVNNNITSDSTFSPTQISLTATDNNTSFTSNLILDSSGVLSLSSNDGTGVDISLRTNGGLVGASDYTSLYNSLSFVQKVYVDNAIAAIPTASLPATQIGFGTGTGITSSSILTFNGSKFEFNPDVITFTSNYTNYTDFRLGYNTPNFKTISIQNLNASGQSGFIFGQNDSEIALFAYNGSTLSGTFAGTSIPMNSTVVFQSGSGYDKAIHSAGSSHTKQAGLNPTNYGYKLDLNGFRIGRIQDLHTSNISGIALSVDGNILITALAGTGNRMVIASSTGQLSTQSIPSTTGFVPYTGGTSALDLTGQTITSQSYTANGTGGLGYVRIMGQSSAPAVPATTGGNIYFNGSGNLSWNRKPQLGTDTFSRTFSGIITADRAYVLPDQAGTVALTSDITTALAPYLLSSTAASTYEVLANKAVNFTTVNNTLYPSVQAVVNYVTGLGYLTTASAAATYQPIGSYEVTTNKATSFGTLNNTLYPTTQAVSTYAGANFVGRVYRDTVDGTNVTGVTTETINKSILIPANTFTAGDVIIVKAIAIKSGSAGLIRMRIRTNTSLSLSGATTVGLLQGATSGIFNSMERDMIVKGATTQTYGTSTSAIDELTAATGRQLLPIDWTVPQYIMISIQNASAADGGFVSFFNVEKH